MRRRSFFTHALATSLAAPALGALAQGCGKDEPPATPTDVGAEAEVELPLDDFVREQLALAKLPGLSIAIVKAGKIALLRHYGAADLAAGRKVADETAFVLGSVSKTTTGAGVMTLVEAGKLSLDEDVNTYLSFKVRHPKFPDQKITLRHLMTHTSGIQENATRLVSLAKPGDPTLSIQELLEPYLVPGGATYVEAENWTKDPPGAKFVYSNFAAALAGHLCERVSGKPWGAFVKEAVFAKLGLVQTSFLLADHDPLKLATPYTYVFGKGIGGQVAEPQTNVPYMPSTTLRTPAKELARFLACVARGGEIDGVRLLAATTVAEMTKVQVPASAPGNDIDGQGLLWEHRTIAGAPCVGHGGSYYGCSTRMHLRKSDGVGVLTLSNGDVNLRISLTKDEEASAYAAVEARLFREAERL